MMTSNLDATSHQWVRALVWLNFELEYQKGHYNTVTDVLNWVTTWLEPDMVRSILNGVALGAVHQVEVHDPTVVKGDLEWEVRVTAGHTPVQMHVTDWAKAQREDPMLSAVLDWLKAQKKTDLMALLSAHASSKEGQLILMILVSVFNAQGQDKRYSTFLWSLRHIESPPSMAAIGMQVIRVTIVPYPCYGSTSGCWEWLIRCNNLSSPACIACNMRAICPKCLYIQQWPPIHWTSCT